MSTDPIIPAEIIDAIIEQLSDDKTTLMSCSLVCKAWGPACRRRLFSQQLVALEPEHWNILRNSDILHYACYVKLVCHHPPSEYTLEELEEILYPLLGFFLIKLPRFLFRLLRPKPPDVRIPEYKFNAELMQLTFPRVTLLVVRSRPRYYEEWYKPGEPYDLLEKLPMVFPRVANLDILESFGTFRDTLQFICSFPELETLTIYFRICYGPKNVTCFRLPVGLKTIRCGGGGRWPEVGHFMEWLSVMKPTPRLVALTFTQLHFFNMSSLPRLLSKIGKTLQHLRLIPGPSSLSSDLLSAGKLMLYLGHWFFNPYDYELQRLCTHVVSKANIALRYLDLRFPVPCYYMHHLPAYIRNTPVEKVTIMVALDSPDQRVETETSDWLTLDEMVVESLAEAPRENFSLCLYIPYLTAPTSTEACARSIFPRCSELGVLSFVYYDDVERENKTMKKRPVVTEFMDPPQRMW